MLKRIKNWIIKVWDKRKDNLEPEEYNLSHDKFAKLIFNDILTIIPSLMQSEYNTISVNFCNIKKERLIIQVFCNIYRNSKNSKFQRERCNRKDYYWHFDLYIDKNNFGSSYQQLVTARNILKSLIKEEPHYSQDEISNLMEKARELDRENIEEDVDNS